MANSPKDIKKQSPLQQELKKVIRNRVAKGLGADISPDEVDVTSSGVSDDEEDVLTELNNTLRFKKKDDRPQPRGVAATEHPRAVRPDDADRFVSRRSPPEYSFASSTTVTKQMTANAATDTVSRRSPFDGQRDTAATAIASSKKSVPGERDAVARVANHEGFFGAGGVGGRKSPLDSLPMNVGGSDRRSPILAGPGHTGGKLAPATDLSGRNSDGRKSPADFSNADLQKATAVASLHRLSPALGGSASQLGSGTRSPAPQLSESSRGGSEASSARQTPRGSEPSTPRLSPLVSEKPSKGGELTMKQKEDIIFGRSGGPADAKKTSATEKSAGSKLAGILDIGDSKKPHAQSKSPKSELDALLADDEPSKEEAKVWKPPQFKNSPSSSALNEEGRKTPKQQVGKIPEFDESAVFRKEAAPKPKPRTSTAQNGKTGDKMTASDHSGRLTPSSLHRHEADSDDNDDHVSQKARKNAPIRGAGVKYDVDSRKPGSSASSGRSTPAAAAVTAEDDNKARMKATASPTSSVFDAFGRKPTPPPIARERQDRLSRAGIFEKGGASGGDTDFRSRLNEEAGSKPAGKKSYLQSLLGTGDNGEHDDDDHGSHETLERQGPAGSAGGSGSYLSRLLQQSPTATLEASDGSTAKRRQQQQQSRDKHQTVSAGKKQQPQSASYADDDFDGERRSEEQLARRRVALRDEHEQDDSSVCFDVDKDPSQLARQQAEREAKLSRFGKGRLTEKQENELNIDEVADAQSSALLRPIEPAGAGGASAAAGDGSKKKQPVKPKACYVTSSGGDSPASSILSRSFESTSDIRLFIYDEWTRAKSAQARKEQKVRALKEKEDEEKKQKEAAEKLSSSKASYDSWKDAKARTKAEAAKERKEEERKNKEQEKKKAETKASAELAFRRWKEEKDDKIKADLKKALKDKREQEKAAKEEQKTKEKDRTTAFTGWKSKKEEHLKQALSEEEKERRAALEKQRREQAEAERKAEEMYREWIHKKEQQKEEERRQRRMRKLQELENPRPAWSPPNKTVSHVR